VEPNKFEALIMEAAKFVGVHEIGNNDGPEVRIFQSLISKPMHQSWCIDFVQYCVHQVDLQFATQNILYTTESSERLWRLTPQLARIQDPVPGCIMVWQHFSDEIPLSTGHAGIVTAIVDDVLVETIEGNTSDSSSIEGNGDGVYRKTRRRQVTTGPMRTLGFLLPWPL
jgi:hypothetical protein